MDRAKFAAERQWFRNQLAGVAEFWLKNGMDKEHGGGEIWFDDVLIREDGIFVLPELEGLNPENLK